MCVASKCLISILQPTRKFIRMVNTRSRTPTVEADKEEINREVKPKCTHLDKI